MSRLFGLATGVVQRLPVSPLPYFGLVATSAVFTLLALGKAIIGTDLDLVLVPATVSVGLVVAALASGGGGGEWSLLGGLRRALGALTVTIPPVVALLSAAATKDTLELAKLVHTQGSLPWQWGIFESPIALASTAVAIAALVPALRRSARSGSPASAGDRLLGIAEWTHKLVLSGALVIAFFGGWKLPGTSDSVAWAALGALSLLLKSWTLLGCVAFLRWALGTLDVVLTIRRALTWLVLPSVVCVLLALVWRKLISSPALAPLHAESGKVLFSVAIVALAFLTQRILRGVRSEGPELGIQFWL